MDPIKVDFAGGGEKRSAKDVLIPPANAGKKIIVSVVLTLIAAAVGYYFMLPALNFKAIELYMYLGFVCLSFVAAMFITSSAFKNPEYVPYVKKQSRVPLIIVGVLAVVCLVGYSVGATVFRAADYSSLLKVEEGNFTEDVAEIDFKSVPVLDSSSANRIAERALGELSDKVSQFVVSQNSAQINYKSTPTRVVPLEYGDVFKWIKNVKDGLPAYITVDMTTQEGKLVRLEEGMKYSPADHFGRYLMRYLRFQYPTYMFGDPSFEIDESGKPYWICPVLDKTIGLFGGKDVVGAVVLNAVTGESTVISTRPEGENKLSASEYVTDEKWQWIDRVYSAQILDEQYNYYGKLSGGFFNSIFGQEGVKVTSTGYNYLALNDDVYMYTGVTSISSDQSIIGFVLLNQRTKETKFYQISGALEGTAQTSAEGKVQQYKYVATFPLLLNISGEPTYFIALKDTSDLVKMYAMVNVKQSTVVGIGNSLAECTENYAKELAAAGVKVEIDIDHMEQGEADKPQSKDVSGKVEDIRTAVQGGESIYYIRLQENATYYKVKAADAEAVVILNKGDSVTFTVAADANGRIIDVKAVK